MQTNLLNKTAIVTGASRGIGKAIAQALSSEGVNLVLAARSEELLSELASQLPSSAKFIAIDLRAPDAAKRVVDFAIHTFGGIDILVNNAGATKRGSFLELSEEDWSDGFALKFYSTVRCSRAAWPHLVASKGTIINIVGIGGRTGSAEFTIGGSVNAAILNLTKSLSDLGKKDSIRVNAINPSATETDRLKSRIMAIAEKNHIDYKSAASQMASEMGIERFATPDEVANAVLFLASNLSSYCSGSILDIDGGKTLTL